MAVSGCALATEEQPDQTKYRSNSAVLAAKFSYPELKYIWVIDLGDNKIGN